MCSDITVSVLKQFFAMRRTFPCNAAWTSDSEFLLLECSFVKPWNLELGSFFVISRGAILCIDLIMQTKELGTCPVRQIVGYSFFYMRISNVYIVMVVSNNANVACAFKFVVEVFNLLLSLPLIWWCLVGSFKLWFKMHALVLFYSFLPWLRDESFSVFVARALLPVYQFSIFDYS